MSARWAGAAGSAARGGGAGDQHHHVYFCGPRVRAKHPWHVDRLQQTRCRNRQPDSHLAAPVNDLQRGGQHCEDRVGSRRRSGLGLRRLGRTLGRRSRGEREDATRPRALVAREVLQEPQAVAIKTAKSSLLQARGNHATRSPRSRPALASAAAVSSRMHLTFAGAVPPSLRRLRGWAYRTRTGESGRALSDWNSVTTSPWRRRKPGGRPFACKLRDNRFAAPPRFQQTIFSVADSIARSEPRSDRHQIVCDADEAPNLGNLSKSWIAAIRRLRHDHRLSSAVAAAGAGSQPQWRRHEGDRYCPG